MVSASEISKPVRVFMSSFEPDRPQVSGSSAPRTESAPDGGGAAPWSHVTTGGGGLGGWGSVESTGCRLERWRGGESKVGSALGRIKSTMKDTYFDLGGSRIAHG